MNAAEITAAQTPVPSAALKPCITTQARLLLVEDDAAIRRYLEVTLQRAGYEVVTAADGLEAMKALLAHAFDAVVTDAIMPHLNGNELCRFIRRHPKFSHVPVILLSALENKDEDSQASVRLAKPVRPDELASCVAGLLE